MQRSDQSRRPMQIIHDCGMLSRRTGDVRDAFVVALLPADLCRLPQSTTMGGKAIDLGRSGCLGFHGSLFVTGAARAGWPFRKVRQPRFARTSPRGADCILARLRPATRAQQSAAWDDRPRR